MKIPCLLQLRETGKSRRKTLRQQTSSGELFCVYRNLRSFFHSAFDLFAAFISISFMTVFLLSFCRLLLRVINSNFLSLFSTHRKSQLTRVRIKVLTTSLRVRFCNRWKRALRPVSTQKNKYAFGCEQN